MDDLHTGNLWIESHCRSSVGSLPTPLAGSRLPLSTRRYRDDLVSDPGMCPVRFVGVRVGPRMIDTSRWTATEVETIRDGLKVLLANCESACRRAADNTIRANAAWRAAACQLALDQIDER